MKRKTTKFILTLMMLLSLCLLCTACAGDTEIVESTAMSPQDDPGEGLGDIIPSSDDTTAEEEGLGDIIPSSDEITADEVGLYEGLWLSEEADQCDYLDINALGNWSLYFDGTVIDEGFLSYDAEEDTTYIYSNLGGAVDGDFIELDRDSLYIPTFGYFSHCLSEDDTYSNDDDGSDFYSWNSELCQRNVAELEGVWYYDEDLSATTYLVIDGYGNWSYYERASGDAEGAEMDYGTFSYSTDEVGTYYADSAMYDGLSIRVFDFDNDVLIWGDDGAYYRME